MNTRVPSAFIYLLSHCYLDSRIEVSYPCPGLVQLQELLGRWNGGTSKLNARSYRPGFG